MFPHQALLDFEGRRLQGARPFAVWEAKNGEWTWQTRQKGFPFTNGNGDVLAEVARALRWCRENIGEAGAAIGFLAYDFARQIEPRAFISSDRDDLHLPDARLVFYEELQQTANEYSVEPTQHTFVSSRDGAASEPDSDYLRALKQILEFIARGDIYQANWTQRFSAPLPCSPSELYTRLRAAHPMPFSALLEWDDFSVVSNSPERFVRIQNRVLTAQPIKGTIQRGRNAEEDETLRQQLARSTKDRAENVMIVDLLRNDLGRVCEFGSVEVPALFEVQTFPTLHHLVSTVRGLLRSDCDAVDAIRACFPCGSITGAPKIRAMQILDELEPVRRGIAMGAVGYFGFNNDMDWNVAIRTITCKNDQAFFHVGGGIVADSNAQDEYAEMQLKARALRTALVDEVPQ